MRGGDPWDADLRELVTQVERNFAEVERHTHPAPAAAAGKEYATLVVAASDSTAHGKAGADYVCDGTADEVEINAAISALTSTAGRVLLLEGNYKLAAQVYLNKALARLEGQGPGTLLQVAAGIKGVVFGPANYTSVSRMYVFGGTRPIDMSGADLNASVTDVWVANGSEAGIYGGGTAHQVVNCRVLSLNGSAPGIRVGSTGLYVGNHVRGSGADGSNGMLLSGCSNAMVTGNYVYWTATGIRVTANSDHNNVQVNTVRYVSSTGTGGYGIDIDTADCDGNMVTNNDLHLAGKVGSFRDLGTGTVTTAGNRL